MIYPVKLKVEYSNPEFGKLNNFESRHYIDQDDDLVHICCFLDMVVDGKVHYPSDLREYIDRLERAEVSEIKDPDFDFYFSLWG